MHEEYAKQICSKSFDVVVIGGGLSGMTAANHILKTRPSTKLIVLEAMSEVGGRTQSIEMEDCIFDLGAQFIGASQKHVIELAKQCGNELVKIDCEGKKVLELKKVISNYSSEIPSNVNFIALIQMQVAIWKINRMAGKLSSTEPQHQEMAYYWDSMTVQNWIDNNISWVKLKVMLEGAIRVILGVELSQVSFLYLLWYIKQSHSFDNLIKVQDGLQEMKTKKGTQFFSLYLKEQVLAQNGTVQCGFHVKKIKQNITDPTVNCRIEGISKEKSNEQVPFSIEAKYIIFAMPPCNMNKIQFLPELSIERNNLNQKSFMGSLIKVIILYKKRYWKEKGFTGESLSDCFDSPVMNGFDDSRQNSKGELQPALIIFIGGAISRYWKEKYNFQAKILQKLAQFYQEPEMMHPVQVHWKNWDEEATINGAPVAILPPGVLTQMVELRRPEGKLHWAGTEMARESIGFLDGAIESGKRAAEQVIFRLNNVQKEPLFTKVVRENVEEGFSYTKYVRGKRRFFEWF